MRLISRWVSRFGRSLRAARIALDPGEDDPGEHEDARPPQCTPDPADRIVLTRDDLLWCTTSEDAEGRITLGLLDCSPHGIGVLVDDNGEALGLRLSPAQPQALPLSLVPWRAHTAPTVTT